MKPSTSTQACAQTRIPIARYARMMELDQREALNSVVISRAFTVYQLSSLMQDLLEPVTAEQDSTDPLIGMLPALYQ